MGFSSTSLPIVCSQHSTSELFLLLLYLFAHLTELFRHLPCRKWFFYCTWNVVSTALFFQLNFVDMHIFKTFCWGAEGSDGSAAGETPLPWWIATARLCLPIHILSHQDHVQTSEPLRMSYTDNQSGKRAYFVLGPFCVGADKAPAVPHAVPGGATHFPFTSLCCPQPSPQAPTLLSAAPTSTNYKCTLLSPVQMCTQTNTHKCCSWSTASSTHWSTYWQLSQEPPESVQHTLCRTVQFPWRSNWSHMKGVDWMPAKHHWQLRCLTLCDPQYSRFTHVQKHAKCPPLPQTHTSDQAEKLTRTPLEVCRQNQLSTL